MTNTSPAVAIAIDASDIEIIDRLLQAGRLPNIASLRAAGTRAVLEQNHGGLVSSVWRGFATGKLVTNHGYYIPKMWRPERMHFELVDEAWPPVVPFWQAPRPYRPRIGLIDVPTLLTPGPDFDGVYLNGWQCHDPMPRWSQPSDLVDELTERFGAPVLGPDPAGPVQTVETLEQTHERCLAATRQIGPICAWLQQREKFDLFLVAVGGAHRGSHYLWDLSQIDESALSSERRRRLEGAIDEIYVACDDAVAQIIAAAPEGARIVLFALHGMGPNMGWHELFEPLIELVSDSPKQKQEFGGVLGMLKRVEQMPAIKAITSRVPAGLQRRITPLWTAYKHDWSKTPFFPLSSVVNGYIRLNRAGRELEGIVGPDDVQLLLERLSERFLDIEDIETGEPIARKVHFLDDIAGPDAAMRHLTPDLVVEWGDRPMPKSPGIRSSRGERRWAPGRKFKNGRTGNHRPNGWMVAVGAGIAEGVNLGAVPAVDLVPTICAWTGMSQPDHVNGRPIESLARPAQQLPVYDVAD